MKVKRESLGIRVEKTREIVQASGISRADHSVVRYGL
jgi:hypothetical protein